MVRLVAVVVRLDHRPQFRFKREGAGMTEAEIWTLACELSESCSGKTREQFVDAVIRETLSRVQPRWPSEALEVINSRKLTDGGDGGEWDAGWTAALESIEQEMARRIREWQTGEQA
jgi:hypothetical protein